MKFFLLTHFPLHLFVGPSVEGVDFSLSHGLADAKQEISPIHSSLVNVRISKLRIKQIRTGARTLNRKQVRVIQNPTMARMEMTTMVCQFLPVTVTEFFFNLNEKYAPHRTWKWLIIRYFWSKPVAAKAKTKARNSTD